MPEPDLAGFAAAQRSLRERFGEQVTFYGDVSFTYPPGTRLDPQTSRPFDPVIQPTASAVATASGMLDVAFITAEDDDARETPVGRVATQDLMLIADISERPLFEGKKTAVVRGEEYAVQAQRPDGVGGLQRYLTWVKKLR